jgi:hypothetical protein
MDIAAPTIGPGEIFNHTREFQLAVSHRYGFLFSIHL